MIQSINLVVVYKIQIMTILRCLIAVNNSRRVDEGTSYLNHQSLPHSTTVQKQTRLYRTERLTINVTF